MLNNEVELLKTILIPHLLKYPLRGTKYLDFLYFNIASHIFENREHLKEEGVNKLYFKKKGYEHSNRFFSI
jgi:hypothetical protein